MKYTLWIATGLACAWFGLGTVAATDETNKTSSVKQRIGVYDSRAIAVAFAGSKAHNAEMAPLIAAHDKAKAEGNQERLKELEAKGRALQTLLHKQGFSTAPVDDILEHIKPQIPEITRKAGVKVIVSKWDAAALEKHKSAEQVDVTMSLVDAFEPSERQRRSAIEIQKHEPISLKQAQDIKD